MDIIVIASGKGGTGKTSLSAGLSVALSGLGKRVLAIDGDSGLRNLDIVLGMSDSVVFSFDDVIRNVVSLEKAMAKNESIENLYLLTAPSTKPMLSVNGIKSLIKQAEELKIDTIIIDGPAGLAPELRMFCGVATKCIVVTTPDNACIRGAERMARMIEEENVTNIVLVVNRVRPQLIKFGLAFNIDDAIDTTGVPLIGIIPEDEDVIACANSGKSIIKFKKRGASKAYTNIAKRIMGERVKIMRV